MRILSTPVRPWRQLPVPAAISPYFRQHAADMLPTCTSMSGRYLHVNPHARRRRFPTRAKVDAPARKDSRRPESRRLPNSRVSIIRFARRQPSPRAAWHRRLPSCHRKHDRKRPRRRTTGNDARDAHPSGHILIDAPAESGADRRRNRSGRIPRKTGRNLSRLQVHAGSSKEPTRRPGAERTGESRAGGPKAASTGRPPVTFACAPRGAADVPLHRKFRRPSSRKRSETGIARHGKGRPSGSAGRRPGGNAARHRARRPVRPANRPESPPDPPTVPRRAPACRRRRPTPQAGRTDGRGKVPAAVAGRPAELHAQGARPDRLPACDETAGSRSARELKRRNQGRPKLRLPLNGAPVPWRRSPPSRQRTFSSNRIRSLRQVSPRADGKRPGCRPSRRNRMPIRFERPTN